MSQAGGLRFLRPALPPANFGQRDLRLRRSCRGGCGEIRGCLGQLALRVAPGAAGCEDAGVMRAAEAEQLAVRDRLSMFANGAAPLVGALDVADELARVDQVAPDEAAQDGGG